MICKNFKTCEFGARYKENVSKYEQKRCDASRPCLSPLAIGEKWTCPKGYITEYIKYTTNIAKELLELNKNKGHKCTNWGACNLRASCDLAQLFDVGDRQIGNKQYEEYCDAYILKHNQAYCGGTKIDDTYVKRHCEPSEYNGGASTRQAQSKCIRESEVFKADQYRLNRKCGDCAYFSEQPQRTNYGGGRDYCEVHHYDYINKGTTGCPDYKAR